MPGDPFHIESRRTAPGGAALAAVQPLLSWLSGLRACRAVYEETQKYNRDEPFECRALKALDIRPGLRAAHLWLRNGGALVVFPAGEVAHRRAPSGQPVDSPWRSTIARLVLATGARVLPAFIDGANTRTFYAAGYVHPALRTALLARELLNKRGATVTVRLGVPVAARDLAGAVGDVAGTTACIRRAVEQLGPAVDAAAAIRSERHGVSVGAPQARPPERSGATGPRERRRGGSAGAKPP